MPLASLGVKDGYPARLLVSPRGAVAPGARAGQHRGGSSARADGQERLCRERDLALEGCLGSAQDSGP